MIISSVKNINCVKNFGSSSRQKHSVVGTLEHDIFVKCPAVQENLFDADFVDWSNETGFYSRIGEIFTDENYLGSGRSSSVYKIPGTDEFVARIDNNSSFVNGIKSYAASHKKKSDWCIKNSDTELGKNFGQQVAIVCCPDDSRKQFQIILYQKGKPIGVPPESVAESLLYKEKGYPQYKSSEMKERYSDSMARIAKLPQQAYVDYVSSLIMLHKNHYIFDSSNSNNLLIDNDAKKIRIVDVGEKHRNLTGIHLDLGFGLFSLINYGYYPTYIDGSAAPVTKSKELRTKADIFRIITKYLCAMKKLNQKFVLDDSIIRNMLTSDLFGEYFSNTITTSNYLDLKKADLL